MHFHLRSPPNVPQFARWTFFERMKFKLRWLRNEAAILAIRRLWTSWSGWPSSGLRCYEAALVREESNHAGAHISTM